MPAALTAQQIGLYMSTRRAGGTRRRLQRRPDPVFPSLTSPSSEQAASIPLLVLYTQCLPLRGSVRPEDTATPSKWRGYL